MSDSRVLLAGRRDTRQAMLRADYGSVAACGRIVAGERGLGTLQGLLTLTPLAEWQLMRNLPWIDTQTYK
jgi:hypothetical protein